MNILNINPIQEMGRRKKVRPASSLSKPRGWKSKSREAYEQGGKAIGRLMLWSPEKEPELWKLVSGTRIWPRWYLSAFRTHYIAENPTEYSLWKNRKWREKHRKLDQTRFLEAEHRKIFDELSTRPVHSE